MQRWDLVCTNVDGSDEEVIPIGEHINEVMHLEDGYAFLIYENILYHINSDGSDKRKLCEEKMEWARIEDDYIYYIPLEKSKKGLYRMKIDGTNQTELYSGDLFVADMCNDSIYFNAFSEGKEGFYMIHKDGTDIKKVNEKMINEMAYLENYDKIIGTIYNESDIPDSENLVIMNPDGSDCQTIQLPKSPTGAY